MKQLLLAAALSASFAIPLYAGEAQQPSPGEIVDAAGSDEWIVIAPSDMLIMELAPDAAGRPRQVIIQLMPAPFSQGWIGNIRKLAAAHWWDSTSVNRVQDNYVVQWGDTTERKRLPDGLEAVPEHDYVAAGDAPGWQKLAKLTIPPGDARAHIAFEKGWPVAVEAHSGTVVRWPVHCYGMVGVGRNMPPDTGSGAELYTVIGHAPRHLDRNIALIGRVVSGIEHLSSLPRGTGPLGFYEDEGQLVPIMSIRMADTLPSALQPRFEYLSTESRSFARYADARANRRDPFFIHAVGGADVCNIPVPIRTMSNR